MVKNSPKMWKKTSKTATLLVTGIMLTSTVVGSTAFANEQTRVVQI